MHLNLYSRQNAKQIEAVTQKRLSLKSMSDRLSVNASCLSALFKKEMGIPLTDYVNRQRIEQAKKITGYTPKVYREKATREHEPYDGTSSF